LASTKKHRAPTAIEAEGMKTYKQYITEAEEHYKSILVRYAASSKAKPPNPNEQHKVSDSLFRRIALGKKGLV
jgi:hypothetical protein